MIDRALLRTKLLRALWRGKGTPFAEEALAGAIIPYLHAASISDVRAELKELEVEGWISSDRDLLTELTTYVLTQKGEARAKQL